jgi:hypothetical protein
MSNLVYPIKNIFSLDSREGALGQKEAVKYYIAPYQRGYKWGSDNPNAAVWLLMSDIKDAFNGNEEEYYLQYITVKESIPNGNKVLEVIDGQQRLTTLTLIYSVLAYRLNDKNKAIANNKLSYKVRENVSKFFKEYIYNGIENLIDLSWEEFISEYPNYNSQDIFYMFHAVQCINIQLPDDVQGFYDYVSNNVKLIFNDIGKGNLSSEKVFSNLNTNKVELTSVELVKGLFLTRAARETDDSKSKPHFKEILELRATMGRQWDEMAHWSEQSEIKSFYFSEFSEPMEGLINLLGLKYDFTPISKAATKYDLFNFFQSLIKRDGKEANILFSELRQLYFQLKDWFQKTEIHNLLGYLFFYKESNFDLKDILPLMSFDKKSLKNNLVDRIVKLIDVDTSEMAYGETNAEIHRLLLFINIFGSDLPFNFKEFSQQKWTLEHIFPQKPDFLPNKIGTQDIALINRLLPVNWSEKLLDRLNDNSIEEASKIVADLEVKLKQNTCEFSNDEKQHLYSVLKKQKLNSIGNMALLSGKDNSSNSNGLFDAKRQNIVRLISKGSFVPKHTYDVFSKLLSAKMEPDLKVWSEQDIVAHENWITARIESIKTNLKP